MNTTIAVRPDTVEDLQRVGIAERINSSNDVIVFLIHFWDNHHVEKMKIQFEK